MNRGSGKPAGYAGTGTQGSGTGSGISDPCSTRTLGNGYGCAKKSLSSAQNFNSSVNIHSLGVYPVLKVSINSIWSVGVTGYPYPYPTLEKPAKPVPVSKGTGFQRVGCIEPVQMAVHFGLETSGSQSGIIPPNCTCRGGFAQMMAASARIALLPNLAIPRAGMRPEFNQGRIAALGIQIPKI
ncbi:hypothetical protein BKA70DRAFT_1219872 [Coprinopsis sp. MPI-PUGE-AT-0042]|nr:hypothetical protein BKA70DRAFT_1219872 [Coprinopsis sp. MPI-PUGE-AT-0042]